MSADAGNRGSALPVWPVYSTARCNWVRLWDTCLEDPTSDDRCPASDHRLGAIMGGADGVGHELITVTLDITGKKVPPGPQRLLVKELDHSIKSLFAVAGGLLTLSARSAVTPRDLVGTVFQSLQALAARMNWFCRVANLNAPVPTRMLKPAPVAQDAFALPGGGGRRWGAVCQVRQALRARRCAGNHHDCLDRLRRAIGSRRQGRNQLVLRGR